MTIGGAGLYSVIVALKPIAAEFEVSRSAASLAYAFTNIGFGVGGIVMGWWSDRVGVMLPALVGAIAVALGMVLAGTATTLGQFVLAHGLLIGLLGNAAVMVPLVADITRWFEGRRGIAVAVVISGNYLAGAVWPIIIQHGIDTVGWRETYVSIGTFAGVSMALLSLVLWRRAPSPDDADPSRGGIARPLGFSPGAMQWLLCAAGLACCVAMATPQAHIVAHATDLGHPAARAAEMLALMLAFGVVSRLAYGFVSDYIGGLRTLIVGSTMQAVALAAFVPLTGLGPLYAMSMLFGLSQGGIVPAYAIVIRRYFPAADAGWRVGAVMLATLVGMGLGGWLAGAIYDVTGSYRTAFLVGLSVNLLHVGIAGLLLVRARFAFKA